MGSASPGDGSGSATSIARDGAAPGGDGSPVNAEERLRDREEELRILLEHLQAGVVVHAPDTSVVLCNRKAAELLGLTPDQVRGKTALDPAWTFLREDGSAMPVEEYPVRRVVDTGRPVEDLLVAIRHPGAREDTSVLVNAFPEVDRSGRLVRVVVTFVDITKVRRSRAELAAVSMVSQIFQWDLPLAEIYPEVAARLTKTLPFPVAAIELYDLERGEMVFVGAAGVDGIPIGHRVPVDQCHSGAVATSGDVFVDGELGRRGGRRHGSLRALRLEALVCVPVAIDGRVVGTIAVADRRPRAEASTWVSVLTTVAGALAQEVARRRAEDLLRLNEEKYRLLHESMTDAYVAVGMDGVVVDFNPAYQQMLGYSEEELRRMTYEELTPPAWHEMEKAIVADQILVRGSSDVYEKEYRRKDGTVFPVELRTFLVRERSGLPSTMWAIVRDISDRRREGEALARSQKLEALGTLAGGVEHDFKNILMAIRGNARLATEDLGPDHPVQAHVAEIDRAAVRAAELVGQILAFARPEKSTPAVLDLAPVVDEALKLLRATVSSLVEIDARWSPGVPKAAVNPARLHQAVVNLVSNGADAIGPRAGRIDLALEALEVGPGGLAGAPELQPGRYACLSVTDTGSGMDRETLRRALDPFFTTKAVGKGSGLGLPVVHGFLKSHGGAITLESAPGRGTTVRLLFPAAAEPHPAGAPAESIPAATGPASGSAARRTEHVLFVDDEEALLFLGSKILGRLGYRVTTFDDPRDALASFREAPGAFDVVVTDISMPAMSGFDLAEAILSERPGIPIVVTSGYIRPEDEERALRSSIRALIAKPNTMDEMAGALDRIFREAPSHRLGSALEPAP